MTLETVKADFVERAGMCWCLMLKLRTVLIIGPEPLFLLFCCHCARLVYSTVNSFTRIPNCYAMICRTSCRSYVWLCMLQWSSSNEIPSILSSYFCVNLGLHLHLPICLLRFQTFGYQACGCHEKISAAVPGSTAPEPVRPAALLVFPCELCRPAVAKAGEIEIDCSVLGLSRLIFSHIILFILPVEHYSSDQPNTFVKHVVSTSLRTK